ncbi:MAG: hypothetical protein QM795_13180 [Pseudoxanthomonas sp.]
MSVYTQVALCIVGMSLYFNAGKIEARNGAPDHALLWAALSLVTSLIVFWAGAGWIVWALGQVALLIGVTLVRVALDGRGD